MGGEGGGGEGGGGGRVLEPLIFFCIYEGSGEGIQ